MMKTVSKTKVRLNLTQKARRRVALTMLICLAFGDASALPLGEQVQAGNVTFEHGAQFLNINQASQKAIVNWQSFSIAANEAVRLNQPTQGVALFRVVGSDPSQIFGSLTATGSLFLSNPNGVLFGRSAQVDVGSLVATSMRIDNDQFLAGRYQFYADGNGNVVNDGIIRTEDGGYIALLGSTVGNNGSLQANNGSVVLGSAQSAILDVYGDGLVRVKLDGDALNAVVKQTGNITADGGAVQLATHARSAAINVNGVVQANSLVNRNGVIRLEGGKNSSVLVSGKLEAKGIANNQTGGEVTVTGKYVGLLDGAIVDVSGNAGGGTVLIGGDYQGKNTNFQNAERTFVSSNANISADAIDSGDGGKVIVWADDITRYYGNITAKGGTNAGNGGFVETSGKNYLDFNGLVDTTSANGVAGKLLLDPTNITISTGTNNIESSGSTIFQEATTATSILNTTTLQNALALNNVEVTTASPAASAGTITVANAVTWSSGNSLTLTANSNIAINASITTGTVASSLILNATGNVTQSAAGIIGGSGGLVKNGAGTATLSAANTYTGATTINTGTLQVGSGGTSGTLGTGVVTNNATLIFNRSNALTVANNISGAGAVNKLGAGTTTLTGNNTYTGTTTISAGTLQVGSGGTTGTLGTGAVTNNATLTFNRSNAVAVANVISGTGALTKTGAGTLTLSGANNYAGATNVNAGTLIADNNTALGTAAAGTTVASGAALGLQGNINIGTESLTISGTGVGATGAIRNVSGSNVHTGTVTLNANSEIESASGSLTLNAISGTNRTLTLDGEGNAAVNGNITTGTGGLTKTGTGTLTLSGANTYTGTTTVSGGTLRYGANNAIATGAVTVNNGGTYDLNGFSDTIGALTVNSGAIGGTVTTGAGTLTLGGNVTSTGGGTNALISGNLNLGAANRTFTTTNAADGLTVSAVISGARNLSKAGAGTLTLSGANTYTSATTVNAGRLVASNANALGALGGGTTVAAGATLNVNNVTLNETAITINGTGVAGAGALTGTGAAVANGNVTTASASTIGTTSGASSLTVNGTFIATNNLTITGAGNITASNAANNFSNVGVTSANNVNLRDTNSIVLGASNVTGNYQLQTNGVITQTGAVTVGGTTTLNAGAGNNITLNNVANNFNTVTITSGRDVNIVDTNALSVGTSNVRTFTAQTLSNDLTLAGNITATGTGTGTSVTIASAQNFINSSNSTITAGAGSSWLVYSTNPASDTRGAALLSVANFKRYNQSFGTPNTESGNGFVYSIAPTITPTLSGTAIKTYDANTTAPIVGLSLGNTGAIDGDTILLSGLTSVTYDNKNAGGGKAVTSNAVSLSSATNGSLQVFGYQLSGPTATANVGTINQLAITGNITADNKVYDATNAANIATRTLTGVLGTDDVTYTGGSATFNNKNAGTGKTVTGSSLGLSGVDAGNYTVNDSAITTADIARADISAVTGITANDKVYDATNGTTLNTGAAGFVGIIGLDTLNVAAANGNFIDANAGAGKTVNITGVSLGGADEGNYNLVTNTATTTADITQRPITVTADPGQSKVFGTADPLPFTFTVGGLGLVGGDTLTGALNRAAGETVGNYAINQGSLLASPNYILNYVGNNFNILAPSTAGGGSGNPRNAAGLVDLNPSLANYTNPQLFVLNVGATAAGADSEGQAGCEQDPESLAKDKDFVLMLNYGLNLPKGLNTSCDSTKI